MQRKIKINDQILFLWNGWSGDEDEYIFDGTVISIQKDTVTVAIHDEKGAHNKFKGYSGKGFVSELGKKYLEN